MRLFLPEDFVEKHFTPRYRPWRQRIAFVPDGDIFQGIASGKASVETDEIERFTEKGILLKSGKELEADIIVTATGFHLSVLGDIEFSKNGAPIDFADTVTWRGMMFTGVPNMVWVFGYFRASWTLRVDLMGDFVCRLINHMGSHQAKSVTVEIPEKDKDMKRLPWIDPDNFNPGYLMRSMHLLPKRGDKYEWQHIRRITGAKRTNFRPSISTATNSSTREVRLTANKKGGSDEPPFPFLATARRSRRLALHRIPDRQSLQPGNETRFHPGRVAGQFDVVEADQNGRNPSGSVQRTGSSLRSCVNSLWNSSTCA